uniref:Putative zinc finger protein n=1 Tax=Ixodes ricinus TaxID=34613 RepID=A0A6B0VG40_IXORI
MLQHQTVLRVLHKTLGLGGLDAAATFRLLGLPGEAAGETAEESSLQATQGRDCTLYRGYLTMQHIMAAFNNAILLGRLGTNAPPPECPDDWDVQDGEAAWDTDTMASAISLYGLARVYKHAVLGQLQRFEEEAGRVFPLTFRLELLENAFSLLFVTHNNLRRDARDDEDATDAEDDARSGRVFPLTFRLELLENAFSLLFVTHNNLRRDARDDEDATDAEDDARSEDPHSPTGSNNRVHQEGNQTAGGEDACHVASPTLASSVAGAKETSDSLSGKGSTASSGAGPSAVGFLCPPFLVPDVLATLCSAVLAAWAASTKEAATVPTWPVQTSVSWDEFASRLDQLRKHIVDAQWRYELITSTSTLDAGPQDESMGPPPGSSSWAGNSESSRDELPVAPLRKLSRKSKRRRRCSSMTLDSSQRSIIEKMLAGPEALLRYCLWHSNYRSAGQVVQMMKLQGSHDDQELHFSQRLEDVTQRLAALSAPARTTTQATEEKTADGLTTLVSQAAGEGLHLTMATALVDRLLCSSGVPGTPEAEHLLRHSPEGGSGMVGTLAERNFAEEYGSGGPHVAAIADLALTVGVPRDVSERLLALAVSKRESYATGNLCGQVRKLTTTLEALRQFVQEVIDGGGVGAVGSCGGDAETSLMALLGNYADVLDAETLQQQRAAWRTIEAVYRKVRVLLECQSSSSSGNSDNRVELHASFLALAKATSGDQRGNLRFLPAFKFDFLRAVYAHTRQLHGAIREASQHSKTKVGRHLEESHLWVLSQSPSALLTRLVLQEEVAPRRLEGVALQMKLSLGHVLARHCCPRILLAPPTSPTPALPRVLNDFAGVPTTAAARHPNFVVKCLLKGLISLLRVHCKAGDSFVTLGGAGALGRSSAFAAWSLGCQELRQVDLCQLQEGAGRLAFFLNLANLLTVHGAVLQAATIPPQDLEECTFVALTSPYLHQRSLQERLVAYHVGQLGIVTLFQLKRKLLFCNHPLDVVDGRDHLLEILMAQEAPVAEAFAPPFHPKVVFALVQGRISDPKLEVIYPETIESQFQTAVDRCMTQIKAMTLSGVRTIIFPWQMSFFLTSTMQLDESCEELRTSLKAIVPEGFVKDFQKEDSNFGLVLDGPVAVVTPDETKPPWGAKLPPGVLPYLEERCPLLMRLLSFMLPKAPKEAFFEEALKFRASPLENLLGHAYSLWVQVATSRSHHAWMAMALGGRSHGGLVWEALQELSSQGDWVTALSLVELVDALDGDHSSDLASHRRNVLRLLASRDSWQEDDSGPWTYAMRIHDLELRVDCVLGNYLKWPDLHASQTLESLQSQCLYLGNSTLHAKVAAELHRLRLYKQIAEGLRESGETVPLGASWKEVAKHSVSDPTLVLEKLSAASLYNAAPRWAELHVVPDNCRLVVAELKALDLLTQSPPASEAAFQLTEEFDKERESFPLWQRVLERLPHGQGQILLLDHLLGCYKDCLMDSELLSYQQLAIGLRMFTCVETAKQQDYVPLVNHPSLLLEQQLMNAEVDAVGRSLEAVSVFLDREQSPFRREAANALLETYASKALELLLLPSPSSEPDMASQPAASNSSVGSSDGAFVMPPKPPPESEWTPDTEVACCMVCRIEHFSMFSRRHHCRRCGRVVCASCSQHSMLVEGFGKAKVRVCDDCLLQTIKLGSTGASSEDSVVSAEQGAHLTLGEGSVKGASSKGEQGGTSRTWSLCRPPLWLLSANPEENKVIREHFYYERAPSVSLCLSILEKHSSLAECATFILSLCDTLLALLAPKSTSDKLVDYGLIITILKSLILRAKVKFLEAGMSTGISWSEAYLRRVDIVSLVVTANCQHLLPDEMLVGADGQGEASNGGRKTGNRGPGLDQGPERKLRDRLMETERMALALEVSNKCGLEKSGVFAAWGLAMLRAGDWAAARDKFAHCLQKPKDKGSAESPLLKEIIESLEKSQYPGISKAAAVFCAIASLKGLKDPAIMMKVPVGDLMGAVYSECRNYLELYGSHRSMLSFMFKHGRTTQALEYYLDKGCEAELFLEELLEPACRHGLLEPFLGQLRGLDPTLGRWWSTLLACCRSLGRRGSIHTLHRLQLFMEDYLRAAVTSIQFFERPPTSSYCELHGRLRHLAEARSHLETYLAKYNTWEGHRALWPGTQVLAMAPKEVNRNVSIVNLQMDVTRFLNARELDQGVLLRPVDAPSDWRPPTLFGDTSDKMDLACLVLINGSNVEEGFGAAFRIIQEHHLEGGPVFERAAGSLLAWKGSQQVERLVGCIHSCGFPGRYDTDAVVLAALRHLASTGDEKKELDVLIRCLRNDVNKIEGYMLAGRLKTAYLLAVRQNRTDHVRRIMVLAEEAGQESVRTICEKRLEAMAEVPR